jgi:hypothetical protein
MCQNDSIKPIAKCKDITITLVGGTKDITGHDVDDGSSDNCGGIYDYFIDNKTFTSANEGDNRIHLTVTDFNNNSSTCTATVTVLTGIKEASFNSVRMSVSPNPFRNIINVFYQLPAGSKAELSIYDLLGKKVSAICQIKALDGKNVQTYDATNLTRGSYIIQLKTSTGIDKRQVIIKQ